MVCVYMIGGRGRCTFVCGVWTEEPTYQSLDSGSLVVMSFYIGFTILGIILRTVQLFIYSVVSYLLQGPLEYIFMAATSKLVAASATYPYQVIRARLQVSRPK